MQKNLYYAISDGGDGSVSAVWFETQELADWYENNEDEGWGEPCASFVTVESDSDIVCNELRSAIGHYLELIDYWDEELVDCPKIKDFVKTFFPNGLPYLTLAIKDEEHYNIMLEGKVIKAILGEAGPDKKENFGTDYEYTTNWGTSEEDRQVQQDSINDISRQISEAI